MVLVGGFRLIASVFFFGLMPSCEIVFPGLTVDFGRTSISLFWHCILCFLDFLGVILVSVCVVPLLRVLQLICRLAVLVFGDQVFGLFSLERWLVCRLVRKIFLDCKIASDCKSSLDLSPMSFSRFVRSDSSFCVCCSFVLRATTDMSSGVW